MSYFHSPWLPGTKGPDIVILLRLSPEKEELLQGGWRGRWGRGGEEGRRGVKGVRRGKEGVRRGGGKCVKVKPVPYRQAVPVQAPVLHLCSGACVLSEKRFLGLMRFMLY